MPLSLSTISRYPVKSCAAEQLTDAVVEPWGLAGDRRWMVVDADGAQVTAREHPQLVLVTPTPGPDGSLDLEAPGHDLLHVAVPAGDAASICVQVWSSELDAALAGDAAHAFFSSVVGRPCRLVYLDDPTRRTMDPDFARTHDRVSFADGYPVHVVSTASMAALNDWIAEGPRSHEGPLPITRFRPNLVVDGAQAWAEDGWRLVRIGEVRFRAVKGCDRCVLTLVDSRTALKGKEPIATLARHRRWGGATWFGMDLIPDSAGIVRVGDVVEVLESEPAPDGPPR